MQTTQRSAENPQIARRVARLDGVRALAALSVACFHAWLYREDRPQGTPTEPLDQALFHASSGLICFFVLSGYLLYGAFARAALTERARVAVGPYLRRRAARIVPAYWVCGAACLVLYALVGFHAITPSASELPIFALFLQNYSMATMGDLNPVTWTLGVEVAFYLLLPLVGWVAWRLGPRRRRAQVGLVLALIAISPAWELLALSQDWGGVAARALPAFLGSFGVGMLVALWAQRRAAVEREGSPLRAWPTACSWRARWRSSSAMRCCTTGGGGCLLRQPPEPRCPVGAARAPRRRDRVRPARRRGGMRIRPAVGWLGWRPLAAVGKGLLRRVPLAPSAAARRPRGGAPAGRARSAAARRPGPRRAGRRRELALDRAPLHRARANAPSQARPAAAACVACPRAQRVDGVSRSA